MTYTVEVEKGLPYKAADLAKVVDSVLSDDRGWTSSVPAALKRVSSSPTFRIRLSTPATTDALCAPLDTAGRLSCRNGSFVVINAWRWANGTQAYGDELANYRAYLINHEFGHALGQSHASCPRRGERAPVMAQQTKGLRGCQPNPWPSA